MSRFHKCRIGAFGYTVHDQRSMIQAAIRAASLHCRDIRFYDGHAKFVVHVTDQDGLASTVPLKFDFINGISVDADAAKEIYETGMREYQDEQLRVVRESNKDQVVLRPEEEVLQHNMLQTEGSEGH